MTSVAMGLAHRTWADGVKVGYAFSPERIAVQLRDDPTVDSVLLADPVRSHVSRLRRRPAPVFSDDPTRQHVRPRAWGNPEPDTVADAAGRQRRVDAWLRRRTDPSSTVLVTSHPVLAAVADTSAWQDVVYYAWDDFRGVPGMREVFDWAHDQVVERDVHLVAVTDAIVAAVGTRRSTVVPNGILASEYDRVGPLPDWFSALPGRVALYAGSLQRRIDVAALRELVRDLGPGWTLAMVGPLQEPEWLAGLAAEPNVVVRPPEPRHVVLSMMAAADVCLVPHIAGTEDMSPLKVYEYLGAGAPVVATDLAPMRGLSERCLLVPPGERLTPAFLRAAALPPAEPADVSAFRSAHDWSARYRDFRQAVLGY